MDKTKQSKDNHDEIWKEFGTIIRQHVKYGILEKYSYTNFKINKVSLEGLKMGKITKYGDYFAADDPKEETKVRKRRLTKEEKEERKLIIKRYNELYERNKRMHTSPMSLSPKEEEIYDDEWAKQERELCIHSETMEKNGALICRLCGEKLKDLRVKKVKGTKEKFMDLFCTHKTLEEFDDYKICLKCGAKFPKKEA